ncbi:unnamed protein product [Acanthocheilonema viteae]|uniref:Uncharacterized protein n=1 Tax=Acanthocheilonema viteae TaxID=6277 RepID=A0A498SXR7_ACAVI|nr:unnamed protein product [Acanthocheilonema viteae]
MVATRMHSKSSGIIKSFSEDQLSSSAVANIIHRTIRDTDTDNLQGSSTSSIIREGHSMVTLKNRHHSTATSTMSHCSHRIAYNDEIKYWDFFVREID